MSWMAPAWASVVSPSQTWVGAMTGSTTDRWILIRLPHKNDRYGVEAVEVILTRIRWGRRSAVILARRMPTGSSDAIEQVNDLTESVEIQQMIW